MQLNAVIAVQFSVLIVAVLAQLNVVVKPQLSFADSAKLNVAKILQLLVSFGVQFSGLIAAKARRLNVAFFAKFGGLTGTARRLQLQRK